MTETVEAPLAAVFDERIAKVFEVFDKSIEDGEKVTLAFSGGKDSTTLALLFYEWIKLKQDISLEITLLHNDTSSEIDLMEQWARNFMDDYKRRIEESTANRVKVSLDIKTPKAIDTFYWRMLIRGYPAPSFNFRWCVHLLKEKPAKLDSVEGKLFTGLREAESSERKNLMRKKYGNSCSASPGGCMAYYYSSEGKGNKIAPFRDWEDADVWNFLLRYRKRGDFNISPLFTLYPNPKVRYGCWHCTLASVQWGLHTLGSGLEYFEAVRILYRKFSDLPYLRIKKTTGYSKLGPLNATGRSIMLNLISAAEELSNNRLYGLDYNKLDGVSLREILFDMDAAEATKFIRKFDTNIPEYRYVKISRVRDISKNKRTVLRAIRDAYDLCLNDKAYKFLKMRDEDPLIKLLDRLRDRLA
ncbi:phosphoadenosine phosphosulfate reductase family protein [Thermoplasmatales archaeon AK]|nr:phosphoadenosine phosphosulfate reductase family protein [Thermoplasmatales archaeon AK]